MYRAVAGAAAIAVLCLAPVAHAQVATFSADTLNCPDEQKDWSPRQVYEYRVAAITRGDMEGVACTYAEDAVVIAPEGITKGRAAIMQNFIGFTQLLGGALPTVTSVNTVDNILLLTFYMHTPMFSILDGADTYVFNDKGQIIQHTVHNPLVWHMPPPPMP